MESYWIYNKYHCATNENFGELEHLNNKKNPRDQLSQQELQEQIEKFTLIELANKLN